MEKYNDLQYITLTLFINVIYLKQTRFDAKYSYESPLFPSPFNVEGGLMHKQIF